MLLTNCEPGAKSYHKKLRKDYFVPIKLNVVYILEFLPTKAKQDRQKYGKREKAPTIE